MQWNLVRNIIKATCLFLETENSKFTLKCNPSKFWEFSKTALLHKAEAVSEREWNCTALSCIVKENRFHFIRYTFLTANVTWTFTVAWLLAQDRLI